MHYHATTYNEYNSFCSNVKEKEEGGGAPSSSFLGVLFSPWCFWLAVVATKKEEEEKEGKKEARKKKKREKRKKEEGGKKTSWGVAVEKVELQQPLLGAQDFFRTFEVQAQANVHMPRRRLEIKQVKGLQSRPPFLVFIFFSNS